MFELYCIDILTQFKYSYFVMMLCYVGILGGSFMFYDLEVFPEAGLKRLRTVVIIVAVITNLLFFLTPSYTTLDMMRQSKLQEMNLTTKNLYKEKKK